MVMEFWPGWFDHWGTGHQGVSVDRKYAITLNPIFHDAVGTTKHNWSAWCQYNVTGWVSMWAYDMLSQ